MPRYFRENEEKAIPALHPFDKFTDYKKPNLVHEFRTIGGAVIIQVEFSAHEAGAHGCQVSEAPPSTSSNTASILSLTSRTRPYRGTPSLRPTWIFAFSSGVHTGVQSECVCVHQL
ncbi:hypothetical protein Trydic_g20678 [Trypoxylus dichotomus]